MRRTMYKLTSANSMIVKKLVDRSFPNCWNCASDRLFEALLFFFFFFWRVRKQQ